MLVYSPSKRTGVYLASNEHHHIHLFLLLLLDIIEELSSVLSQLPVGERERERVRRRKPYTYSTYFKYLSPILGRSTQHHSESN